jgi:hypothetical protein
MRVRSGESGRLGPDGEAMAANPHWVPVVLRALPMFAD